MKMSDHIAKYLEGVVGTVEADSYAKHSLWADFSQQSDRAGFGRKKPHRLVDWESAGSGYFIPVGTIADHPIYISILVDVIDGHRILFWYVSGSYNDHNQVEKWLTENVPGYANRTDATNFFNVFSSLRLRDE